LSVKQAEMGDPFVQPCPRVKHTLGLSVSSLSRLAGAGRVLCQISDRYSGRVTARYSPG
jgi:hypothetical protein